MGRRERTTAPVTLPTTAAPRAQYTVLRKSARPILARYTRVMPTISAASTPSRRVTTSDGNIDQDPCGFDFENEFQFQLEILRTLAGASQQNEKAFSH